MKKPVELKVLLKKREKDTHKGDYGHIFVLAGSRGLTGAAALCANAGLRSGAGLVTLGIPLSLNLAMEAKLTEVMTLPLAETEEGTVSLLAEREILKRVDKSDVVVLGPGLSGNIETKKLICQLLVKIKKNMVLDADALNAVSENVAILKEINSGCIITPHSGEMARLVKKSTDYVRKNRRAAVSEFLKRYKAVVVLKGSGTIVAEKHGTGFCINKSGNPGMATAGSGDVLTGIIGGFLAQGLAPFDAARLAVYVHGLAGDLAAKEKGEVGIIASDILEKIPYAIRLMQ